MAYTNDADHRLVGSSEGQYWYDANGNVTGRVVNGVASSFAYDYLNRLVYQRTGSNEVKHIYDGRGWRIGRVENGVTNRFVLDYGRESSHLLGEIGKESNTVFHLHGRHLIGIVPHGLSPYYLLTDASLNVVAVSDSAGEVTESYTVSPYGIRGRVPGTAVVTPFTYAGALGIMEDLGDTYFMRARFYDAGAARFLSKDPLESGRPGSWSPYTYANNSPLMYVDPLGLSSETSETALETWLETSERRRSFLSLLSAFTYRSDALEVLFFTGDSLDAGRGLSEWTAEGNCSAMQSMAPTVVDALWLIKHGAIHGIGPGAIVQAVYFANESPTYFGAPRTVTQDLLGPDWQRGGEHLDLLYGPRRYRREIMRGTEWLFAHPEQAAEGFRQFGWGEPMARLFDSLPGVRSWFWDNLVELKTKGLKGARP